jgi:FlaA1/EpsC-like NDP-sugar epimerase
VRFSVVRYGNVMGSRGSVIPFFLERRKRGGKLPITDPRMTRFNITLQEGVDLVLYALANMWGGELFVPRIPSYRITDVAEAVAPGMPCEVVGIRPGEKLHEDLITESDAINTVQHGDHFVILPSSPDWSLQEFMARFGGAMCPSGFRYCSATNTEWLTVPRIRQLLREHVDATFQPGAGE